MPISPEKMALYPGGSIHSKEWLEIRTRISARAHNCCEKCGVQNHALGGRLPDGLFLKAQPLGDNGLRIIWPKEGDDAWCGPHGKAVMLRIIRIVCTVAHIDGKLVDHSDNNLRFWCQRCHLNHDQHLRHIAELEAAGQLAMFDKQGDGVDVTDMIGKG